MFRSLTEYPKSKFLCHANYAQIYCLSEKYESCTLPALVTPYVPFLFFFLSSLTRDWTQAQWWKHKVLTTGLPGSSLGLISMRPPCMWFKLFPFSPVNTSCVSFIISPATRIQEGRRGIPLPDTSDSFFLPGETLGKLPSLVEAAFTMSHSLSIHLLIPVAHPPVPINSLHSPQARQSVSLAICQNAKVSGMKFYPGKLRLRNMTKYPN